jgi:hypothetical protein
VVYDRRYSQAKLLKDAAFVKKFVIPLLKDSIGTMTTATRILLPIAGVKYTHQCNESKRKRDVAFFQKYNPPSEYGNDCLACQ